MSNNFNKSVKNVSVSLVCQILTLLLSFVSRSVFIKFLSAEYLGISGLFSNILTLLSFTELGIGNVMIYSLYEPIKRGDDNKIQALLALYKKAYNLIAAVIFVIGCLVNPFILYLVKDVPNIPESIHLLFFLYLANTAGSYICTYKKSLLLADQKAYVTNLVTSLSHIGLMIGQVILLYLTRSFIAYLICQIVCTLLTNLFLTLIVNRQYRHVLKAEKTQLSKQELKTIFKNIKALAISKVSGIVSNGTNNIVVSKMFGLIPVGLISNYTMIINSVNNIFYGALTSMTSSIGNFNVDSDVAHRRKVFDELFLLVYLVYSFICVCLLVLTQPFVELWLGVDYQIGFAVLLNLVLGVYVGSINYPVYSFRTTKGYFKEVQYVYVACAVLTLVLSIFLGWLMGIAGVFMSTWVSKLLLTEVADSYYTYNKILEKKHILYFLKYGFMLAIAALNATVCYLLVSLIGMDGWLGFLVKAVVCAATNIILNIAIFAHRAEFKNLFQRVIAMIRRR